MITYIGLLSFTDKGLHAIKDTTKRADRRQGDGQEDRRPHARHLLDAGRVRRGSACLEAEDEAALAAFSIATAQQGNVRTRTLRGVLGQ